MAFTTLGSCGAASVRLVPQNRILGSNSKSFTGIVLKKPQQVGALPLHVRGSIASSPRKLFSPKAAAPKSGDGIRIAVLGASGYTGAEIVRFLANHPQFHIKVMTADRKAGEQFGSVFPHLRTQDLPRLVAIKDADFSDVDAVFCCLPHGTTQEIIKSLPRHLKIVDLSAVCSAHTIFTSLIWVRSRLLLINYCLQDFRLRDINEYAEWYGHSHRAPELQEEAVYGLTELQRDDIRNARLVANPGCYPTSIQLPLVPLVKAKLIKLTNIIIDAKSGVSGAGRGAKEANLYTEIAEGIHAYGITSHRHVPEIEQGLTDAAESKVTISFTPHLMCMTRGMQSTIYVELASGVTPRDLYEHLKSTYEDEEFVKLLHGSSAPHTSHVKGSNYCFMNVYEDRIPGRAIIISVIDNLVKGASGQALQNLNLMMGLPENMGLQYPPLFP
ncbi:probable N-acetyl-gamma-glutamyl-phosphate reductase, chloroplastic isoform X1 [Miscanthus floridulus]|uniref:probable N-acetyl-gamma-glutamyl-phosphate reductase, chloroplastic isoform X1 n=1 Tax=Miscanthus floridulus TaxID=154761 RepID=UPI00345826E1